MNNCLRINAYLVLYAHTRLYMLGVVNQPETKSHISYYVNAKSHISHMGSHEHHPTSSSLTHTPCSARYIVNITHQHDNDRTLQAVYCYACYLVGRLALT